MYKFRRSLQLFTVSYNYRVHTTCTYDYKDTPNHTINVELITLAVTHHIIDTASSCSPHFIIFGDIQLEGRQCTCSQLTHACTPTELDNNT